MASPSRAFMIQQSILNAALPHAERNGGLRAYHRYGVRHYLDCVFAGNYVRDSFCDQVRKEYRLISNRYSSDTLRSIGGSVG